MNSIITFALLLFISFSPGTDKSKPVQNKDVQFKSTVVEKTLRPGATGTLQITLTPSKGIHVNVEPAMSLQIDSTGAVTQVDKPAIVKDEKKGTLDASKPVTVKFTLAKTVKPGPLTLKGSFTYFYCSDAEGWCNRFKQPVEVKVTVSK